MRWGEQVIQGQGEEGDSDLLCMGLCCPGTCLVLTRFAVAPCCVCDMRHAKISKTGLSCLGFITVPSLHTFHLVLYHVSILSRCNKSVGATRLASLPPPMIYSSLWATIHYPMLCLSISSSIQLPLFTLVLLRHLSLSSTILVSHPSSPFEASACVTSTLILLGSTKSGK